MAGDYSSKVFRCVLLSLLAAAACHAGELPGNAGQCPGASEWIRTHPDDTDAAVARRDAARTLADPSLRGELERRVTRDQATRVAWLAALDNRKARDAVARGDADNVEWLRSLIGDHGFPTAQQVGERGVFNAWLLLHHADRDPRLQEEILPTLAKRHADGELRANELARTTDRVLVAQDRPQRYGSQYPVNAWLADRPDLPDGQNVRDVDARRASLGLMPLADYVCMMNEARRRR